MHNMLASEEAAILGMIDPDAYTAATYTTGWIDMAKFGKIMAIVMVGDLGSSATVNAKLEQATTSGGSPSDVTGKAITPLTDAGSDSNKQAIINCLAEELDIANGYRWVRLSITVGTATSDAGGIVLGLDPRYAPASDNDAASVDEIVA